MKNKLEIDSVILEFGEKRVLQDVYMECETGKITGLLGRNGCGKTCLMNIIYGPLIPQNYSVRINGKALLKATRSKKDMRYLPQFRFIPESLTIKRIFKDFGINFSSLLDYFPEFTNYQHTKLLNLSVGERRIIEIFIMLASDTKFCLLDEPFSHIMPVHIEKIKQLILKEKDRKGILITDHLFEHITEISDFIYLIKNGKTFPVNSKEEIKELGYSN